MCARRREVSAGSSHANRLPKWRPDQDSECRFRLDHRPSPTNANRNANLRPNFVQIAQCRVTAPAESGRWLVILLATAIGRTATAAGQNLAVHQYSGDQYGVRCDVGRWTRLLHTQRSIVALRHASAPELAAYIFSHQISLNLAGAFFSSHRPETRPLWQSPLIYRFGRAWPAGWLHPGASIAHRRRNWRSAARR